MKLTYVRNREGRHSRQTLLIRSAAHKQASDKVMRKIGFVPEGEQLPLDDGTRCCKCGGGDFLVVKLPDEAWCRPCVRMTFGGEL